MGKWASKHRKSRNNSKTSYAVKEKEVDVTDIRRNNFPRTAPSCHSDTVTALTTSHGKLCASGSKDCTVILQDLDKGQIIERWNGHTRDITKIKFNGHGVLTSSRDKTIRLWERGRPSECGQFIGHTLSVNGIDCSDDGNQICSGSRDNSVKAWDVETFTCIAEAIISRNLVTDMCWSWSLSLLAQTAEDKILKLWDPRTMELVHSFIPQGQIQTSCSVYSNYCVTTNNGFAGKGCEVCVWDLRQRILLQSLRSHSETVSSCAFTANGESFVSCSHDGSVKLWNAPNDRRITNQIELQSTVSLNSGSLTSISVLDAENILCSSFDRGIRVIRIEDSSLCAV